MPTRPPTVGSLSVLDLRPDHPSAYAPYANEMQYMQALQMAHLQAQVNP